MGPRWRWHFLVVGCALALAACSESGKPAAEAPPVVATAAGVEMVRIPAGWFVMGSDAPDQVDERPHRVWVDGFLIDRFEVTQREYERLMGKNPSRWKRPECPVDQVRWPMAAGYCNARSREEGLEEAYDLKTWACDFAASGYRLPTEAEWERACRAGTTGRFSCGDGELAAHAWFKDTCDRRPRPVGQKAPNPWGLHDVHGNVWEWCNDFYAEDYYARSPERNPRGPDSGNTRVVRGGYWNSRPDHCRSSYREHQNPGYTDVCFGAETHGFVGFRCVRRPR